MDEKSVRIIVASSVGQGKSTVAELIQKLLNDVGYKCELFDMDFPTGENPNSLDDRVDLLKGITNVTIETAQLNREGTHLAYGKKNHGSVIIRPREELLENYNR